MNDQIKTVGVIGLGVMGFDIAFLYAMKGFRTRVYDGAKSMVDSLINRRGQTIDRLQKRNRISLSEVENLRALLKPSADLAGMSQCDLSTEAVSENAKTKFAVYKTK